MFSALRAPNILFFPGQAIPGESIMKYYHGAGQSRSYFEGWYLKYQTRTGQALALIPAVHMDEMGARRASLQVISNDKTWWLEYPEAEFSPSETQFHIRMGRSVFGEESVRLEVERDGLSLRGTLRHGPFTPLKSDIMGPFRFFPGLECSHGVISMGHSLEGSLTLNGETLDFSGGAGYVETDRGRSFPASYLWTQCTWGEPRHNSLMLSIATIPLKAGIRFTGCICAVFYNGQEYRLATYRGVRIKRWSRYGAEICQGKYRLTVEVLEVQGRPLRAPVEGTMHRVIHESLCAKIHYRFWSGTDLLFEHTDSCAGFEYADQRSAAGPHEEANP